MAKEKMNKVVGNSFEDLKDEEMKKTQGAGDVEGETIATPVVTGFIASVSGAIEAATATYEITKLITKKL